MEVKCDGGMMRFAAALEFTIYIYGIYFVLACFRSFALSLFRSLSMLRLPRRAWIGLFCADSAEALPSFAFFALEPGRLPARRPRDCQLGESVAGAG
jgi:hypothetical protein